MSKLKQTLFSLKDADRKIIEEKLKTQDQQINQLKQQLEESFTEEDVEGLIEDRDKTIKFLKKELAEKDKEIERLKNLFKLNNEVVMNQGNEIFDLRVQVLQQKQNQTQLAIQELGKVKVLAEKLLEDFCNSWQYNQRSLRGHRHIEYYDLIQGIDNQIKELKGE